MEKMFAFFRRSLSRERNPITLVEIIIKTVQHGKAEIGLFFFSWMDKVIDTSKYFYETAWHERWTC